MSWRGKRSRMALKVHVCVVGRGAHSLVEEGALCCELWDLSQFFHTMSRHIFYAYPCPIPFPCYSDMQVSWESGVC